MYHGVSEDDDNMSVEDPEERNLFQVWDSFRITEPEPWYCYARIAMEIVFLFLWPFINMLLNRNYPVALVFFMLGSFTFLWRYFDSCAVFGTR